MRRLARAGCIFALLVGSPVFAVQPGEMLADPALEARAREISKGLRCLVCRNEAIDESNADLARDLRLLVRERIMAGDDDAAVLDYVVERYGEYVLLTPRATGSSILLWLAGPAMLLGGAGISLAYMRRRAGANEPVTGLTAEETARLRDIVSDQGSRSNTG